IRWTPEKLMSCPDCVETEVSPIDGQEIGLELTHSSGCTYSRSFQINVKEEDRPDIFIPNAFSPNDDGNNDSWQIYLPDGIDQIDRAMLFDRWGNKIAEWKNTPDVIWDGTYRDKPMNPGVFVYVVEYRNALGQQQVKSGDVTLVR
ncbi:MAG TPA: gliding motility-associated C-terminal domain-containing protein, partial [Saprospiraceae bacterium]|nr:gliding motility-associated C-terminal domain-containing protein [Saprospiraceae bacterium]